MSKNRRKHPRVRAKGVAAHLRTQRGRAQVLVENVSMGGIFVRTDRLEEVGAEIFVDIVKPGWKKLLTIASRVTSRVDAIDGRLSARMPGMGLQFLQLDEKQHERLSSLLRELGAPDDSAEVTLSADITETELRALDLPEDDDAQPLDPQPQPVWQQVDMVQQERAREALRQGAALPPTGGARMREALVEDAIAGALQELDLGPPPGPVVLKEEPRPAPPPPPAATPVETAKLMAQLRGMAMQLSDLQHQLSQRDLEVERLKEELENTKAALERVLRKN